MLRRVETIEELAVLEPLQPALYQVFFFSQPIPTDSFHPDSLQKRFQRLRWPMKYTSYANERAFEDQSMMEHAILEKKQRRNYHM